MLGSGGWGTALAVHLARLGKEVRLWGRDASLVEEIAAGRVNETYLPGIELPDLVRPTASLEDALRDVSFLVAAVPSHGTRDVVRHAKPYIPSNVVIVSATKGLEAGTLLRMSEVIEQELGAARPIAVLSGPSFSLEVAREAPTAVSVAGSCAEAVAAVQHDFRSGYFRLYTTEDVVGVEIGGAMKNVIAIAAGGGGIAGVGPQRACGSDHPWPGGDLPSGLGGRGPTGHVGWAQRPGGPRAHMHWSVESQPCRRDRARVRSRAQRHSCGNANGGRRCADDGSRPRPGGSSWG